MASPSINSPRLGARASSRASAHSRSPSASSVISDSSINERRAENVTVAVRLRPPNRNERRLPLNEINVWETPDPMRIRLNPSYIAESRRHSFDQLYDAVMTNIDSGEVYHRVVKDVVKSAMEGYNGTVFAYGQTSSGKTYGDKSIAGVIPRAVSEVFSYIREQGSTTREYLLRVAYLEIYNEQIKDLLSPENLVLKLHEDSKRGVYVSPLKEEIVTSVAQVMRVIRKGESKRHVSTTDYNEHSSRSHTIFQLIIESRERGMPNLSMGVRRARAGRSGSRNAVRISQLNLIDLAGSEKASVSVERRRETAYINKSLLTLGTVISKLTNENESHIPYRDSKLTRLLQTSLSGNARVAVICTLAPSATNLDESLNTLKFASSIKQVTTSAHTNQVVDDKALLQKYRLEIMELKARLIHTNEALGSTSNDEIKHLKQENKKFEEEVMELQLARTTLRERIDHLTELILTSSSATLEDETNYNRENDDKKDLGLSGGAAIVVADLKAQLLAKDREIQAMRQTHDLLGSSLQQQQQLRSPILEITQFDSSAGSDTTAYEELDRLKERNNTLELSLKEMENNMANIRTQVEKDVSGGIHWPILQELRQKYLELMFNVDEQNELIAELEEECRGQKGTIAELRNTIRKLELAQFEQMEATAQTAPPGSSGSNGSHKEVTVDEGQLRRLAQRIKELEASLQRERTERAYEQQANSERVASLEADLTITKAELTVAKLTAA
ncbi:P-loop containing nucleoside triphosphate hydrolase protein [Syncephalis fuscata]|nr:P-loop containing nucleoside triphosphate hydrolase protein [Syncephalis fuscata]